jgi:hypothetical protein
VIAIISESRSASVRNRDRHHLGTLIAIARNTQVALALVLPKCRAMMLRIRNR